MAANEQPDLCAIVLAGGRSRRMGQDKAWIEIDAQPLIVRILAQLAVHTETIYLSVGAEADARYTSLGPPLLRDELPDAGPLAGLASALSALQSSATSATRALVVSCDTPELPPTLIRRLIARSDAQLEALVVEDRTERLQPLLGCYRVTAGTKLQVAVGAGERRMRAVETLLRLRRVPLLDGEELHNLNTPESLARYLAQRAGPG